LRAEDPMTVVIFGASGDLAKRKLIPALYHLHEAGVLPERFTIVGTSRTAMSDDAYRDAMVEALRERTGAAIDRQHPLVQALHYHAGAGDDPQAMAALKARVE